MSAKGRFGGLDLGAIAQSSQTDGVAAKTAHKAHVPIGELAVRGATAVPHERLTLLLADPRRCRAWKFHNRHPSWYTRERCADLIDAIGKEEQLEAAIGRRLEGDPDYDFELIYGMRRRFACEFLNKPLKVRITTVNDKQAAVLMHQENADRQDITAMERAISYTKQLRGGVFKSQDEIAAELNVSKSMVSQMVISAELLNNPIIAELFPDPTLVPVKWAYAVAVRMTDAAACKAIEKAAKELASSEKYKALTPTVILKALGRAAAPSAKLEPFKKAYNVGERKRMVVTRNGRGKVTLAFTDGLTANMEAEVVAAIRAALKEL